MNLKEWKQFSDAVDKHNFKLVDQYYKTECKTWADTLLAGSIYTNAKIEKTIINFYEWQVGKLKLIK